MWREMRVAIRSLKNAKGLAVAAIAVIALCIGANTAIYTVVNAVLWTPMKFFQPAHLVSVAEGLGNLRGKDGGPFSGPDYLFLEQHAKSFESMAAYMTKEWEISGIDRPERIKGARVSAALFHVLGVAPELGRTFTEREDESAGRFALLSGDYWRNTFGADRAVIGRTVYLDRQPYTIIGIMPPSFVFPQKQAGSNGIPAAIYVPMSWTDFERSRFGYMYNKSVIARLKPDTTAPQAGAEVRVLMKEFEKHYPSGFQSYPGFSLSAVVAPYQEQVTGRVGTLFSVLMGAVGLVLLVGCANVANLLLARSVQRRREFAMRCALGAGKGRLIKQNLLECLLLSIAGGGVGILLAAWITPLLIRMSPVEMPRLNEIALDWRAVVFATGICCLIPMLFGFAPALESARLDLSSVLREGGRGGTQSRRQRSWMALAVVAQYAFTVVLLVGAGLLMHSFLRLRNVDPGFRTDHTLTVALKLPAISYTTAPRILGFFSGMLRDIRALPGVELAGAISDLPLKPSDEWGLAVEGKAPGSGIPRSIQLSWISGDALRALRVKLIRGRLIDDRDGPDAQKVVVVNETMARLSWPDEDPIGKRIGLGGQPSSPEGWRTVMGVIADVRQGLSNRDTKPQVFQMQQQVSAGMLAETVGGGLRGMHLIVRATGEPISALPEIRRLVARADSALPITEVLTLDRYVSDSINPQRFDAYLMGVFAGLALLLALIGIAGVLSYTVAQRTGELGIRMALGGRPGTIMLLVLSDGFKLASAGLAIGLVAAAALSRFLSGLLYEAPAFDAVTFVVVPLALIIATIAAALIPAHRATHIDPIAALRAD
jgi:putative ABC transport system permease protein